MTRINLILLVAVLGSAMALVRTSYEGRRVFTQIDRARNEEHQLDADRRRLDAEREAQATNWRVERVARDKLAMRAASPAVTYYVAAASQPQP